MTEINDEVNIPLLRKAVEWAEEQHALGYDEQTHLPLGEWYQGEWREDKSGWGEYYANPNLCGTAYCVAGYVGQLLEPRYAETTSVDDVHVSDFAREALGLDFAEADRLFSGGNNIESVRRIAEQIAGERL